MLSRAITLTAALLLSQGSLGCGGGTKSSKESAPKAESEEKVERSGDEKWTAWQWKGDVDECFFRVENQCFRERAKACKAAGCEGARCETNDGAPAKVSCRK